MWQGAHLHAVGVFATFGVQDAALAVARVAVHDGHDEVTLKMLGADESVDTAD